MPALRVRRLGGGRRSERARAPVTAKAAARAAAPQARLKAPLAVPTSGSEALPPIRLKSPSETLRPGLGATSERLEQQLGLERVGRVAFSARHRLGCQQCVQDRLLGC